MSSRKSDSKHDNPTPDDLAGIPVCREETSSPGRARATTRTAERGVRARASSSSPKPTPDDLAGICVSGTGKEDVAVRPGKKRRSR
jgi:hypothetical protein